MSEKHNENELGDSNENTNSINRRRFVKTLSVTGTFGVLGVGGAQAQSENDEQLVAKLSGDEAQRVFESLSRTPRYGQLKERVTERGEQLLPDETTIIRVNGESKEVFADVPIVDTDADEAHLGIGQDEETGEVTAAALQYDEEQGDGKEIKKTTIGVTSNSSPFEKTTQTINPERNRDIASQNGLVTPAHHFDLSCASCTTAVNVVCTIGCGASTFIICNALSAAGLNLGQFCDSFVEAACNTITMTGPGCDNPRLVCAAPQLQLCSSP